MQSIGRALRNRKLFKLPAALARFRIFRTYEGDFLHDELQEFREYKELGPTPLEVHVNKKLSALFPLASLVESTDISGGCGAMMSIKVVSSEFKTMRKVKRHQIIYEALTEEFKTMHGLRIQALHPDEDITEEETDIDPEDVKLLEEKYYKERLETMELSDFLSKGQIEMLKQMPDFDEANEHEWYAHEFLKYDEQDTKSNLGDVSDMPRRTDRQDPIPQDVGESSPNNFMSMQNEINFNLNKDSDSAANGEQFDFNAAVREIYGNKDSELGNRDMYRSTEVDEDDDMNYSEKVGNSYSTLSAKWEDEEFERIFSEYEKEAREQSPIKFDHRYDN